MADPELAELRRQRMAQLQSQYMGNEAELQQAKARESEQQRRDNEEKRNIVLSQILDQAARARLNTLTLGKPEKGQTIENYLLNLARNGLIPRRLGEPELIAILEDIYKTKTKAPPVVKFDRRRAALDSDDDDL